MQEWWRRDWIPRHILVAPFGVLLTTALLAWWGNHQWWNGGKDLEAASQFVDLAAVLYGVAAVTIERGGNLMFWALEQRRLRRERLRKEIEEEVRAETEQRVRAHLQRVSQDKGIPLEDLLPRDYES